jgi:hypothetical protein
MTLKEKFKLIEDNAITWSAFYDTQVQIADDYAVAFAKWCRRNQHSYDLSPYSYKELLEIFKKEQKWK